MELEKAICLALSKIVSRMFGPSSQEPNTCTRARCATIYERFIKPKYIAWIMTTLKPLTNAASIACLKDHHDMEKQA